MNLWHWVSGTLWVELTSGEPERILNRLTEKGMGLSRVERTDVLTLRFVISRRDWQRLRHWCRIWGCTLRVLDRRGLYWHGLRLLHRPVLLGGMAALLGLVLLLPGRILFVQVEGNLSVPANRILEAAEDCGIRFGADRRSIRSERLKNELLARIPRLRWAGINTFGCRAVICVREKQGDALPQEAPALTGIAAALDGCITEVTVTGGSGLCVPGQQVTKGQLLISPYTDCGICFRAERAQGEVYAETRRHIRAILPRETPVGAPEGKIRRRYSLILGKKRINFYKGSGISDTSCDRMYKEYCITLPGELVLPVRLGVESLRCRELLYSDAFAQEDSLEELARDYLSRQMIAGRILEETTAITPSPQGSVLDGDYLCREMIGREYAIRIGDTNEQTD